MMFKSHLPIVSCNREYYKVLKAITAGLFMNVAKKDPKDGYLNLVDDQKIYLHPSSSLFNKNPEYVVYNELIMTSKEYMRNCSVIDSK